MINSRLDLINLIKEKFQQYTDTGKAKSWLDDNLSRVKQLFENYTLRDFIFEPFQSVFQTPSKTIDANIYSVITQVAIINMVLAGLPGKMGVGVWVSVALEGWMAYSIARHVGIEVRSSSDIWKYFGMLAATVGGILYGVRLLIGVMFSAFSMIPWVNPLILAELIVTDLVGVLFWVGFLEASNTGSFSIPKRMWIRVGSLTKELALHQGRLLKNVFNKENIKLIGVRLRDYLKGEFPVDQKIINGETFATAAMAYLIAGHYDKLQGPLGETFMEAVRLRWSSQFDENTNIEEIADKFREYDADQIDGVINTIKGKMFEIMVTEQENLDGDNWIAKMHTDETFPGSDIVFTDIDTGDSIEVSLKAASVGNEGIIEHALARYPDIPIMTTDEMAELYGGDERVFGSQILHEDLDDITNDRFDELVSSIEQVDAHKVVVGGVTMGVIAVLWPFVVAYLRNRITREQLDRVFKKALGDSGVKLASRLSYATIFGPLFAWYLLARGVKGLVMVMELKSVKYIEYIGV
ncbi:MAG: hypothetical protein KAI17_11010 [Thiotrichaceae bacterium]|nr:hypothetical protein [Thiotrichaceae bacterium]